MNDLPFDLHAKLTILLRRSKGARVGLRFLAQAGLAVINQKTVQKDVLNRA
jgi:hypothetical protein